MDILNSNAIIFGTIGSLLSMVWILVVFGIATFSKTRILEFSIELFDSKKIHRAEIGNTQIALGWLPFGCNLKILGLDLEIGERKEIPSEDQPYAFFNKPKWVQLLFALAQPTFFGIVIMISLALFQSDQSLDERIIFLAHLSATFVFDFFMGKTAHANFLEDLKLFCEGQNPIIAALVFSATFQFLYQSFLQINRIFEDSKSKFAKVMLIIRSLLGIAWMLLLFLQFPRILLTFFGVKELVFALVNALAGISLTLVLCYVIIIGIAKILGRNNLSPN